MKVKHTGTYKKGTRKTIADVCDIIRNGGNKSKYIGKKGNTQEYTESNKTNKIFQNNERKFY